MAEKKHIRKQIFEKRKELTQEQAEQDSREICKKVFALSQFQKAACVYAYVDYNKEVCTREIIEKAWEMGKRVAVPKVTGPGTMKYYYLESFEQLKPGYFQIPEPVWGKEAEEEDAFLIVPGVAFDENRHRAGYGQGFMTGIWLLTENIQPLQWLLNFRLLRKCLPKLQMCSRIW